MRRVSTAGAVFTLLAILITPAVFADDPPPGTEPPQVRIAPPGGVSATDESPSMFELLWVWLRVRIGPPIG
ncbi:MAG TPA: hypothetical protein VEO54_21240 [Thermoanaerobaculia bacterium]|nr:hypothetical protein [Thermoanaerobaculia bacterium]